MSDTDEVRALLIEAVAVGPGPVPWPKPGQDWTTRARALLAGEAEYGHVAHPGWANYSPPPPNPTCSGCHKPIVHTDARVWDGDIGWRHKPDHRQPGHRRRRQERRNVPGFGWVDQSVGDGRWRWSCGWCSHFGYVDDEYAHKLGRRGVSPAVMAEVMLRAHHTMDHGRPVWFP